MTVRGTPDGTTHARVGIDSSSPLRGSPPSIPTRVSTRYQPGEFLSSEVRRIASSRAAIEGNLALISGDLTSGGPATEFELQVFDGGPGGEDRWTFAIGALPGGPLEVCNRIRYEPALVVQQGNIVVRGPSD